MAGVHGPFALQVGDQRKQQRQAKQEASDGVREPVPAQVDDAIAHKEDHEDKNWAEPRAIPAERMSQIGGYRPRSLAVALVALDVVDPLQ